MLTLLEWFRRLLGTLGSHRRDDDLEEELRLHMELAAEHAARSGASPAEARRVARVHTGGVSQAMDALRDRRGLPWLQSLVSDIVFASRQLNKHRGASLAAILSLGIAIGAATAAFRLMDAVLWRTLPVASPDRLHALGWDAITSQGDRGYRDDFDYPTYRRYRAAAGSRAQIIVIGSASRQDVIIGTETERAIRQYVSGNVFATLGLQPVLGRLLGPADDEEPSRRSVVVISYEYWTRRFNGDPQVVGKTFRWGRNVVEIVGIAPRGFTGTEPGRLTDFFAPATMNTQALNSAGWSWFRIWVRPNDDVSPEQVRESIQTQVRLDRQQTVKNLPGSASGPIISAYLNEQITLTPAGAGVSSAQRTFKRPLFILAALVVLVLLIACANVANLLVAQGSARAREMALRVSIGAGRLRLIQLVLVESALLALCASIVGAVFSWWAAPFVVSLLSFQEPVQLVLDLDWRTTLFSLFLTMTVTMLFGLAPALRASSVTPLGAVNIRRDPPANRRLVRSLISVQMAFCLFVIFVSGLFGTTLTNLSNRPLGFDQNHVLVMEVNVRGDKQPPQVWEDVANQIRSLPGVESASSAMWVPLTENRWRTPVAVAGQQPRDEAPYFLGVSPKYFDTMRIGLVAGRDFHIGDVPPALGPDNQPIPGVGIVSEAFARAYFDTTSPVGRLVTVNRDNIAVPMKIIGVVGDAAYYNMREPMRPTVYVPTDARSEAALVVRTSGDPLAVGPSIRREVARVRADFIVTNAATQSAFVQRQLIRERLLSTLSLFFAGVALLLAGIGLYGVLNYAVIRERHEIGVRMALGARASHVVARVTNEMLSPVGIGAVIGVAAGVGFGRLVESILFEVKATDPAAIAMPVLVLAAAAAFAALPPVVRAVHTDPAQTLRSE